MENGSHSPFLEDELLDPTENGVVPPIMVKTLNEENDNTDKNEPNEVTKHFETTKANGENIDDVDNTENDSYTSESDALVIDESVPKKSKKLKNKRQVNLVSANEDHLIENSEIVTHSNPFFNESLFELSQLHQTHEEEEQPPNDTDILEGTSESNCVKQKDKKGKSKPKPKLREYTHYLGLQPTVQFRCSKCGRAGFDTLSSLQEHVIECKEESVQETPSENACSGFKLTRKVFLCSACGTYYENWNLYMHMLEIHRRFICLYCLGMFSILEDLCQHIQSRHNLQPGHKNTLDEFFNVYNEPCYVVCCECNKLFSEQDNFFYHNCVVKVKNKKLTKQQITPENHVTGESESVPDNPEGTAENHNSHNPCDDGLKHNQIGDNKTLSDNITMETNGDMTEVANEAQDTERNCHDQVNEAESLNCATGDANVVDECHLEPSADHPEQDVMKTPDMREIDDSGTDCSPGFVGFSKSDMEDNFDDLGAWAKELESSKEVIPVETRKVPKLSLKIPKFEPYPEPEAEESDDSEKLTMEVDQIESENDDTEVTAEPEKEETIEGAPSKSEPHCQIAGPDVPVIELELEQPLDKFDPCVLLQKCLRMTAPTCIYCNHARKIAVNGRQLGLHCIAEHRFSAVVNSITAEELIPASFVSSISDSLPQLDRQFFSLDTNLEGGAVTFSHLFECFQCRFSTAAHKELYLHNRKFHSKNLLLCIMCKSSFHSYSELTCHLCPGQYVLDHEPRFRCCMCCAGSDLPSSFRLMVHLRKRHHACDVCLEPCHSQTRLSSHVWKHKLHHFCYRCGIAYRNKPDITRHLFWKHGTESVQCRRCMQKRWPHVYHFCSPPATFACDECGCAFGRAVALRVHRRLHGSERKWRCGFEGCGEGFVSRRLVERHEKGHYVVEEVVEAVEGEGVDETDSKPAEPPLEADKPEDKPKQMIDVLDLPALNLSESDSSDSEPEPAAPPAGDAEDATDAASNMELPPPDLLQEQEETSSSAAVAIQTIWDNFKSYQESRSKLDNMFVEGGGGDNKPLPEEVGEPNVEELSLEAALRDHDYCVEAEKDTTLVEVKPALNESTDHDYCSAKAEEEQGADAAPALPTPPPPLPAPKKGGSSSSSSDSDSSSCSCGSNCSCSSSSGRSSSSSSDSSNSDSSTEEGRRKQLARRQKRRERAKKMRAEKEEDKKVVDVVTTDLPPVPIEAPIRESDLDTTETESDEEFYDEAPQKLAKKLLDEKRQQLIELLGPNSVPNGGFIESTSRPPTPPAGVVEEAEEERKKKKSKSKKRKKRKSERRAQEARHSPPSAPTVSIISPDIPIPPYYQQFHQQLQLQQQQPMSPTVAPITLTIPPVALATPTGGRRDAGGDSSLRASKRRRVPNKFYGYSSDEDRERDKERTPHVAKWKKVESAQPLSVPPLTIKTTPARPPPPARPPTPPPPQPTVEPISIRTAAHLSDFRVRRPRPRPTMPAIRLGGRAHDGDSATDSNDSSSGEEVGKEKGGEEEGESPPAPRPAQPQLYCYCQCPYDEVSEMIGCDATDCAIEWFHFECVGIMVPPKGQWYCPDCRKKKARRELTQSMRNK